MKHPPQQPFNPDTFQNLAGMSRIERAVFDKITDRRLLIKFYRFSPTITHGAIPLTFRYFFYNR
jgi:hypothetical protein